MTQEEIDAGMAAVESELRFVARELDIALDAIEWQWGSDDSWIVVVRSGTAKEQDRLTVRQLEDYESPGVAVQLRAPASAAAVQTSALAGRQALGPRRGGAEAAGRDRE